MDFGKLDNISQVDFSLPPDHVSVSKVLKDRINTVEVYTGCPIWTDKSWVGSIYPEGTKANDFLFQYARQFNAIELNATHYKIPDSFIIERWKAAVTPDFKFCPKVPQVISHAKEINLMTDNLLEFIEQVKLLENNLGNIFLQLPPYCDPRQLPHLIKLLEKLPAGIPLSIEFRHPGWFNGCQAFNDICNFMYKRGIGTVITDTSGRRDVIHQRLSNKTAFIRFAANNLHPTDYLRIDEWVRRLIGWISMGLEKIYFCVHTPDKSFNPELVYYFVMAMNKAANLNIPPPKIRQPFKPEKLF